MSKLVADEGWQWHKGVRIGEARRPGPEPKKKQRGAKPKVLDIVILNSSGRPQLLDAMAHFKKDQEGPKVVAIVAQEHHAESQNWNSLQFKAKGTHWHLQGARQM